MPQPSAVISVPTSTDDEHLVEARLLDVQDLALQRQDRLRAAIAALLGGAAGGVALDDEDLGQRRILFLAVGELAGQARDIERALAAGHLARLARGLARARGLQNLVDDGARFLRMLQQEFLQLVARPPISTTPFTSEDTSLSLVCEENFGSGSFTDRIAVSPSRASSPVVAIFSFFADELLLDVVVERARERAAKTREVRAAVLLRDVVGVAVHALLVGVVPLHRHFDRDRALAGSGTRTPTSWTGVSRAVQIA